MIGVGTSLLLRSITKPNKFQFCQIQKAVTKLQSIIDEQISAEQRKLRQEQMKSIAQQLQKKKWKVNYKDAFIEIQREGLADYQVKARVKVRSGGYTEDSITYLETNLFINRINSKKMMIAKYISMGKKFELVDFKIIKKQHSENQLRSCSELDNLSVPGSNLQMVEHKITEGVFLFLLSFGLDPTFFESIEKIHENYELNLYIQWLSDLRSLT